MLDQLDKHYLSSEEQNESIVRVDSVNTRLDRFHSMFRTYHECFLKQSGDRRTQVMRVACESLAKIVLRWRADFVRYANKTIEKMMESVRQKIEITHILMQNLVAGKLYLTS